MLAFDFIVKGAFRLIKLVHRCLQQTLVVIIKSLISMIQHSDLTAMK